MSELTGRRPATFHLSFRVQPPLRLSDLFGEGGLTDGTILARSLPRLPDGDDAALAHGRSGSTGTGRADVGYLRVLPDGPDPPEGRIGRPARGHRRGAGRCPGND